MEQATAVRWVLAGQALVGIASGAVWWAARGGSAGLAAVAGALIALLPALYMGLRTVSIPQDAPPRERLGAFYRGEAVKFGLTAVLFILALQWFASTFAPVIVTYILALLVYWPALALSAATQR